jgi:O-antigen ligase
MAVGGLAAYRHPALAMGTVGAGLALVLGVAASFGVAAGLLVLAGVPLVFLALQRPGVAALVLVAAAPVVSGIRRGLPVPSLRLSEILIAGLAVLILLTADRSRTRPWRTFDWLALGYASAHFGLGFVQLLSRGELPSPELLGTLLSPFQYLLLYRTVLVALPEPEQQRQALRLVLLASVPVSASALLQDFNLFGVRQAIPDLTGVDVDKTYGSDRATGTFPHWQVLAGYEFWILLLCVVAALERERPVMSRGALAMVVALAAAAALATVTLTVLLAVIAGAVALAVWYGGLSRVLPVLLILGALSWLAYAPSFERRLDEQFGDRGHQRPAWVPQTMDYRYRVWRYQFLPVVSDGRWWTGYGPDLPPTIQFRYTESLYVTMLMRGGLPLLFLYVGLMAVLFMDSVRARGDPVPARRGAARVMAVALVLLIPMHSVETYFIFTGMATLFWITAGLALAGLSAPSAVPARAPRTAVPPRPVAAAG